jgi:hypothetical protein
MPWLANRTFEKSDEGFGENHSDRSNAAEPTARASPGSLFSHCANPRCTMGWIRLWRSRRVPGFEGRWACSFECMGELVASAVRRETDFGRSLAAPRPHRLPMGLMLVEQGRITPGQLRTALEGRQQAIEQTGETIRLGEWLMRSGVLSEPALARALSAQWNCPIFSLESYRPEEVAAVMPRFFSEVFGALPVRVSGGKLLYMAFSERIDRSLSYALERIGGLPVTAGIVPDSEFVRAQARLLATAAPRSRYLEAASSWVLARSITRLIESRKPVEARLARIHDYYWLRMFWRGAPGAGPLPLDAIEDVLCTVGTPGQNDRREKRTQDREDRKTADKASVEETARCPE